MKWKEEKYRQKGTSYPFPPASSHGLIHSAHQCGIKTLLVLHSEKDIAEYPARFVRLQLSRKVKDSDVRRLRLAIWAKAGKELLFRGLALGLRLSLYMC